MQFMLDGIWTPLSGKSSLSLSNKFVSNCYLFFIFHLGFNKTHCLKIVLIYFNKIKKQLRVLQINHLYLIKFHSKTNIVIVKVFNFVESFKLFNTIENKKCDRYTDFTDKQFSNSTGIKREYPYDPEKTWIQTRFRIERGMDIINININIIYKPKLVLSTLVIRGLFFPRVFLFPKKKTVNLKLLSQENPTGNLNKILK